MNMTQLDCRRKWRKNKQRQNPEIQTLQSALDIRDLPEKRSTFLRNKQEIVKVLLGPGEDSGAWSSGRALRAVPPRVLLPEVALSQHGVWEFWTSPVLVLVCREGPKTSVSFRGAGLAPDPDEKPVAWLLWRGWQTSLWSIAHDTNDVNKTTFKTLQGTKRLAIAVVQEEMKWWK